MIQKIGPKEAQLQAWRADMAKKLSTDELRAKVATVPAKKPAKAKKGSK